MFGAFLAVNSVSRVLSSKVVVHSAFVGGEVGLMYMATCNSALDSTHGLRVPSRARTTRVDYFIDS